MSSQNGSGKTNHFSTDEFISYMDNKKRSYADYLDDADKHLEMSRKQMIQLSYCKIFKRYKKERKENVNKYGTFRSRTKMIDFVEGKVLPCSKCPEQVRFFCKHWGGEGVYGEFDIYGAPFSGSGENRICYRCSTYPEYS